MTDEEQKMLDQLPGRLDGIQARLDAGDERFARVEADLAENTAATNKIAQHTESLTELAEFFGTMKSAFKVLNWIGKLAKPIGYIVAACVAVAGAVATIKGGGGVSPR